MGSASARAAWSMLEAVAEGDSRLGRGNYPTSSAQVQVEWDWTELHDKLALAHPHAEASAALAWLFLFGVPDVNGRLALPGGFPRDVDRAVAVAREGASLRNPTCGRCFSLLALLLSVGFPPLVNVAHATKSAGGQPLLIFAGDNVRAKETPSVAAKLPRDIGRPDPVASAYSIAARAGDLLGALAMSHLSRHGILDSVEYFAPRPNQASAATPRRPTLRDPPCDPLLTSLLGEFASEAVDSMQSLETKRSPLRPLAAAEKAAEQPDAAWLQHVLAAPEEAPATDLARAADLVDAGAAEKLSSSKGWAGRAGRGSEGKGGRATELRKMAAEKGSSHAALRVAVDHLQRNETEQARPLLQRAEAVAQEPSDQEMARYYMRRFTDERPDEGAAWSHLVQAADLGRPDAELLVAHAHASGGGVAGAPTGKRNQSEAIRRYRNITQATGRGRLVGTGAELEAEAGAAVGTRTGTGSGSLSEVQSFAAYNLGVLSLTSTSAAASGADGGDEETEGREEGSEDGQDKVGSSGTSSGNSTGSRDENSSSCSGTACSNTSSSTTTIGGNSSVQNTTRAVSSVANTSSSARGSCTLEAQMSFEEVVVSQLPFVRVVLALEQRAARVGDTTGALLLASLLSDLGHNIGHSDAAFLWDSWARRRPSHLGVGNWEPQAGAGAAAGASQPCNLAGWWTTGTPSLAEQNVSRVFVSAVEGGGFEMFNASLEAGAEGLAGIPAADVVLPRPARSQFRHLHSFLWHTVYEVFRDGAPVPVALQPPGAVPHLVEQHHQRGKLVLDETCSTAHVEGMYVNWTFHRLGAPTSAGPNSSPSPSLSSQGQGQGESSACADGDSTGGCPAVAAAVGAHTQEFLHCWLRPDWYFQALEANLAAAASTPSPAPPPDSWQSLLDLTGSRDCPCHGAFACRGSNGACLEVAAGGEDCPTGTGSRHCPEVEPSLEPPGKPLFAAAPEVCALAYHRRAAHAGQLDAMHVLSHAHSNGLRGATRDAAEALAWSRRAAEAGDPRGRFDVAYSLEFGLGTQADPSRAHEMYMELLRSRDLGVPLAARASSFIALLAASGRYVAGKLLGLGSTGDLSLPERAPWSASGGAARK